MGVLGATGLRKVLLRRENCVFFVVFKFGVPPILVLKFRGFWFFDGDPAVEWASRGHRARPSINHPYRASSAIELI